MKEFNRKDFLPFDEQTNLKFCPIPFFQLSFFAGGNIAPCCQIDDYHLGDIQRDSILKAWNGPEIQALRKEFLTGKVKTCAEKQKELRCHLLYERFLPFLELSEHCHKMPQRLELRLNSKCNLRCKMCSNWKGESGIYQDYFDEKQFPQEVLKDIKEITLLGGEPFIQSSTFELIQKVQAITPECLWLFTTNLNYDFATIESYLKRIRISCIQMSLDSLVKENYQEIRRQGNFELALKNIDHFIAFRQEYETIRNETFRLQASFCIQKDNYKEIESFIDFCRKKRINPHFQFAYLPHEVSLLSLPREEQEHILSGIIDLCNNETELALYPVVAALSKHVLTTSET